jgi:hypothetical protein
VTTARVVVALLALGIPRLARAGEPWRMAVVVGNNSGSGARPPLRYAEDDAVKVGQVLVELGGFAAGDVHVLTGQPLSRILAALAELQRRIGEGHAQGRRAVVLFYFSGHSDGQGLEVGGESWPFADVRSALGGLGAEIRLAIVDSCRSGALLARKGGTLGPKFEIRFTDDLATSGEAVLTSSAADEMALESAEIRGSFFSHHLVSGLRGAADASGDGKVTLNEAYWYAFVNTLLATSGTLSGPQHPGYGYSISGQGELVLTRVGADGASLTLPHGFDRVLISDGPRRALVAELTSRSAPRVSLPPGRYLIHARRGSFTYQARVDLAAGESRTLDAAELAPTTAAVATGKGDSLAGPRATVATVAALGAMHGTAAQAAWLPAFRLGLRGGGRRGWLADLDLGSARGEGFRESALRAGGGLFLAPWRTLQASWRLFTGPVVQSVDHGPRYASWAFGTGPALAGSLPLGAHLALVAAAGVDAVLLRRDDRRTLTFSPTGFLGLQLQ